MLNYINNNLVLINEYQNLYFQEINIDKLIEGFRTEDIIMHNGLFMDDFVCLSIVVHYY